MLLGRVYYLQEDYLKGFEAYRQVINTYNDPELSQEALFQLAWGSYMLQDYQLSSKLFQNVIDYYPHSPDAENARFWKGLIYSTQGDHVLAAKEFHTFLGEYPQNSGLYQEALWQYGEALYASNDLDSAQSVYDRLFEQFPENPHARAAQSRLREIYYHAGEYDMFFQSFEEMAKYDPGTFSDDAIAFRQAMQQILEENYGKAQKEFTDFVKKYPTSQHLPEAYYQLGRAYYEQNKMKEALQTYQELVAQFPSSAYAAQAQYKIGDTLFRLKQYQEALQEFSARYSAVC